MKSKQSQENADSRYESFCIQKLTEAERNAKQTIDLAKKRKLVLIKRSREESANELDTFKRESEENLTRTVKLVLGTQLSQIRLITGKPSKEL